MERNGSTGQEGRGLQVDWSREAVEEQHGVGMVQTGEEWIGSKRQEGLRQKGTVTKRTGSKGLERTGLG